MNSKECEEQLKSLVEAWDLDEADLNQTDIEAIKHLMLENKMQQDKITELRTQISARETVVDELQQRIDKAIEYIKEYTELVPFNEDGEGGGLSLCDYDVANVLEILKGSDN